MAELRRCGFDFSRLSSEIAAQDAAHGTARDLAAGFDPDSDMGPTVTDHAEPWRAAQRMGHHRAPDQQRCGRSGRGDRGAERDSLSARGEVGQRREGVLFPGLGHPR